MTSKKTDQDWELDELERAIVGIGKETYYNYRCPRCGYEQEVPDFVVDEFAAYDELPPGVMPELECGNCGGTLRCVDQKVAERSEALSSVLFSLSERLGTSREDSIEMVNEKSKCRGGFKNGIFLESVLS